MSDHDKAKALNDYLDRTITYDYDAFEAQRVTYFNLPSGYEYAWNPYGALIDKKAVCGGYATAFKVLADQAGLDSIVVTGVANGGHHAWNKVKLEGRWRALDPTWNDDPTKPNAYFALSDQEIGKTHLEDTAFISNAVIERYAAH